MLLPRYLKGIFGTFKSRPMCIILATFEQNFQQFCTKCCVVLAIAENVKELKQD